MRYNTALFIVKKRSFLYCRLSVNTTICFVSKKIKLVSKYVHLRWRFSLSIQVSKTILIQILSFSHNNNQVIDGSEGNKVLITHPNWKWGWVNLPMTFKLSWSQIFATIAPFGLKYCSLFLPMKPIHFLMAVYSPCFSVTGGKSVIHQVDVQPLTENRHPHLVNGVCCCCLVI